MPICRCICIYLIYTYIPHVYTNIVYFTVQMLIVLQNNGISQKIAIAKYKLRSRAWVPSLPEEHVKWVIKLYGRDCRNSLEEL